MCLFISQLVNSDTAETIRLREVRFFLHISLSFKQVVSWQLIKLSFWEARDCFVHKFLLITAKLLNVLLSSQNRFNGIVSRYGLMDVKKFSQKGWVLSKFDNIWFYRNASKLRSVGSVLLFILLTELKLLTRKGESTRR